MVYFHPKFSVVYIVSALTIKSQAPDGKRIKDKEKEEFIDVGQHNLISYVDTSTVYHMSVHLHHVSVNLYHVSLHLYHMSVHLCHVSAHLYHVSVPWYHVSVHLYDVSVHILLYIIKQQVFWLCFELSHRWSMNS